MKKILFIIPDFPSISETFILNQITSLIDLGYDVDILSTGSQHKVIHKKVFDYNLLEKVIYPQFPPYRKRVSNLLISIFQSRNLEPILKSINPFRYGVDAFKLTAFCKIQGFLNKNNDYDVIHIHFGQNLSNYELLKDTGLISTNNVVLTFHGYDLEENHINFNRKRYKRIVNDNIKITVNTPYLYNIFKKTFPNHSKSFILPVGLDINLFVPDLSKREVDTVNIVFCGRLIKLKGINRLPSIFDEVLKTSKVKVKFHIVGDGDAMIKKNLLEKIDHLLKSQQVIYYQSQTQEAIVELYKKCDFFILPGIYDNGRAETQGLVIQEAQAMQLPVVVTDAGGMKYGLIDGKTGFVVDYLSNEKFIDKILFLIHNKTIRLKMGERARDFVVNKYNIDKLSLQLMDIYNS